VIGDRAQIGTYAGAVRIDDDVAASCGTVSAKMPPASKFGGLAQLRRFEHIEGSKYLRSLEPTPEGRHYSGIGGTGPAVILGGG
jgi:hypothetical protein